MHSHLLHFTFNHKECKFQLYVHLIAHTREVSIHCFCKQNDLKYSYAKFSQKENGIRIKSNRTQRGKFTE
jgi:hypothetical protein